MAVKKNNVYLRFTSVGLQMGAVIGGMVWLGTFLQKKYAPEGVWFTVGFSLFGVCTAIYLVIKEVMALSKEDKTNEK